MNGYEGNGYRVLIVDNDVESQTRYRDFLHQRGFEVETANNGETGLDRLIHGDFNVALVELALPVIDGLEMIRRAKDAWVNTRIIILTTDGKRDDLVEAVNLNVDYWFDKQPNDRNGFLETVAEKVKYLSPLIPPETAERLLAAIRDED